jgi:drug/metabolite transporter (DMT)-like permease
MHAMGPMLCLLSAAAFGAMGIFGKLSYEQGTTVGTLLSVRFVAAATLLWVYLLVTRRWRTPARRDVLLALGLGAIGYGAQAGAYFTALERIDPGILSLLLYTFPAIVTVAAIALGRERLSVRAVVALGLASTGLVLVLSGAGSGALDTAGVALGMTAALVYSVYILTSQGISTRVHPAVLSTLVCSGAAVSLTLGATLAGEVHLGAVTAKGYADLAGIAVISTVAAIGLFFAGLSRVGPTAASIFSTLEPVVTVTLAWMVFGESFGASQLIGGALVLSAVFALSARVRARRVAPAPA